MACTPLVQRVTLDPASWTPVTPPGNRDSVVLGNLDGGSPYRMRIIAGDPNSELTIPVGAERLIAAPANHTRSTDHRFMATLVAFYLQSDSGTGPAVLLWA